MIVQAWYIGGAAATGGGGNSAPVLVDPIPDMSLVEEQAAVVVDLSSVFSDPGDSMTFAFVGQEPSWATILGSTLTLAPAEGDVENGEGAATITVRATDSGAPALTADDTFKVTVFAAPSGGSRSRVWKAWSNLARPFRVWPTSIWP